MSWLRASWRCNPRRELACPAPRSQYRTEPDLTDPTGVTIKTRFAPVPRLAFGVAF